MRRRFRGIVLLLLAAWMFGLTYLVIKHPEFFMGEQAGAQQVASDQASEKEQNRQDGLPLEAPETEAAKNSETRIAVSAVEKIEWGQTIGQILAEGEKNNQAMFQARSYPTALLPEGFIEFDQLETYADRILMVDLKQDKPLLKYKLRRSQERLIEERTEEGHLAMAVKVDEVVGVSGYIKPYSRVDVLVTLRRRKPPETRTVLRNVLVLAAGGKVDRVDTSLTKQLQGEKGEKESREDVSVVTLQVSPEQAEKLALASSEGKLRLALRNPLDKEYGNSRGVTLNTLLRGAPAKRSRSRKVVVIKGSKVETQFFR